jgi:hypothetical protein
MEPVKMLSKKLSGPPPDDDCADASPDHSATASAAATAARFRHRTGPVSTGFMANLFLESVAAGRRHSSRFPLA